MKTPPAALIFDLDNCLAAADEPGEELYAPAFDAIRAANGGRLDDEALAAAFADCWRHPLDWVAEKYGFSPVMLSAGWEIFREMEVSGPMKGYGDLHCLAGLPCAKFLVTSGFRRLQESKIRALSLEYLFTAVHVDAIDEPDRPGKLRLFERIMAGHGWAPGDVVVVGDNADSELAAGRQLGLRTVQTLRPGVPRDPRASFHIRSLGELGELFQ